MEEKIVNNKIVNAFAFLAGAAIGGVVTWKLLKTKYEQLAQEEIDSVKEVFSKREKADPEESKNEEPTKNLECESYDSIVKENKYNHSSIESKNTERDEVIPYIHVIPPESAGENDYDISSLTYYTDGILTDEREEIVENVNEVVGLESLNHFGEYEDDSVWVRNDKLKMDFEILCDLRNYSDVISRNSHPVENNQCEEE